MTPTRQSSFRLFHLWGIEVYLHWSWFLVAFYSISSRIPGYESPVWGALEYGALFVIVLMHEFGHALACRQVGGRADQIVLWPLGGVAYVAPPQRPGATLWSIAAGPLVNVVLMPLLLGVMYFAGQQEWVMESPDLYRFLRALVLMNLSLLCFNLLPIFPLDGGQILRSLLWYPLGKARSLMAATVLGFVGGVGLVGLALWERSIWMGILAFFLLAYCWSSFQQARVLLKVERLPRRREFVCPVCRTEPPIGPYWRCACGEGFDSFATVGTCPKCGAVHTVAGCPDCGSIPALISWDKSIRDV